MPLFSKSRRSLGAEREDQSVGAQVELREHHDVGGIEPLDDGAVAARKRETPTLRSVPGDRGGRRDADERHLDIAQLREVEPGLRRDRSPRAPSRT